MKPNIRNRTDYTYIPVAGKYYCLQANLNNLAWIFIIKFRKLHLNSLGLKRGQLPRILKVIKIYRNQLKQPPSDTRDLPVFGHMCMPVHRGFKVFNFTSLTATKIFYKGQDDKAAAREVASVREASSLSFTPTLIESAPDNYWYRETFTPGHRSPKNTQSNPWQIYRTIIVDHLSEMLLSKPQITTGLKDYSEKINRSLRRLLVGIQIDNTVKESIEKFIFRISNYLDESDDIRIYCGFTHGDFSFVNFLYDKDRITVIDWETAKQRSIMNDLYNYFFTELYYRRTQSNLLQEIDAAIPLLENRLTQHKTESISSLMSARHIYRWLYYLERMEILLDREMTPNVISVIQRSMEVFNNYESIDCNSISV